MVTIITLKFSRQFELRVAIPKKRGAPESVVNQREGYSGSALLCREIP